MIEFMEEISSGIWDVYGCVGIRRYIGVDKYEAAALYKEDIEAMEDYYND